MTIQRHARDHADLVRDRVVMLKLILPAPAIEAEGGGPRRTRPEDRSGVAQPDVAEAPVDSPEAPVAPKAPEGPVAAGSPAGPATGA
jgi:hypothetical protein